MSAYQRPAFWRVPRNHDDEPRQFAANGLRSPRSTSQQPQQQRHVNGVSPKRVHFKDEVQTGSPAQGQLLRGDIVTKIRDYDSRDLTHQNAHDLFKAAVSSIPIVVRRDSKLNATQNISADSSRCPSSVPPYVPQINLLSTSNVLPPGSGYCNGTPHRAKSPLPNIGTYEAALESPVAALPHTEFPHLNESGAYIAPYRPDSAGGSSCFSPMPTRDHQQELAEETASIVNQPYRTTPLVLPGAKVKKDVTPTESYLRHHPNPAMRGPVHHTDDVLMKQRFSNSQVQHKQFNSPIGLYSDSNIENTIRQTVPSATPSEGRQSPLPSKLDGYKPTLVYDPSKSETYRALHEDGQANGVVIPQEIPLQPAVQPKVYQPNRLVPGKKQPSSFPPANPQQHPFKNVNQLGESNDIIHQSHSFKRLMYSVMGESDY